MISGFDIFKLLYSLDLRWQSFDWLECNNMDDFELLCSVVLTQNTKWDNVIKALKNLKNANINNIKALNDIDINVLAYLIKPSGFYNIKAKRLKNLTKAIIDDFKDLNDFKNRANRQWLLDIKGLGYESVDSVLNYLCKKEIMVVDKYSYKLALNLGYEMDDYEDIREFYENGINEKDINNIINQYNNNPKYHYKLYEIYQIFHALIIEFGKKYFKSSILSEEGKEILKNIENV